MENRVGYPCPQPRPVITAPTTVVAQHPVYVNNAPLVGPKPMHLTCPSCNVFAVTRIDFEPSTSTHLCAGVLCLVGCCCLVCLPYCGNDTQNVVHHCSRCKTYIGTYRR